MPNTSRRCLTGARAVALSVLLASGTAVLPTMALAQEAFTMLDKDFTGEVRLGAPERGKPVLPGGTVKVTGEGFEPGQAVDLGLGFSSLLDAPATADDEGRFEATFTLPDDAAVGTWPLILTAAEPYGAAIAELKVSPEVALSNADAFETTSEKLVTGLYQSAYSPKNDTLFVTSAIGRPPVKQSTLLKLDAETLEITDQITPQAAPPREGASDPDGGVFAVYGVGVDDENGNVWVTNTRNGSVAVYSQADLSLVKQFEAGITPRVRDVVIVGGKAYVSPVGTPALVVFDTKTLEETGRIEIESNLRGQSFAPTSIEYDADSGKLYTVSMETPEVAIIDPGTGTVDKVIEVEGMRGGLGVDYDSETGRIFLAAQDTDNLLIVDAESGEVLHDVPVGAGALSVEFEPVTRHAYVSSRGAGTVTIVDVDGRIVANLENAPFANHVLADGEGNIYAINKSRGADDENGDRITRIAPK